MDSFISMVACFLCVQVCASQLLNQTSTSGQNQRKTTTSGGYQSGSYTSGHKLTEISTSGHTIIEAPNSGQNSSKTFTSGKDHPGSLNFIIIGDWGGQDEAPYTTNIQLSTAARMEAIAKESNISFILALGGNFLDRGVKDVHDSRFQDTFERVYNDYSLLVPWYIVAGNTDWLGNVSAQIQYTKHSLRWNFPFFFHPVRYKIPGTEDSVDILLMDTAVLCGAVSTDYHDNHRPIIIDRAVTELHWAWLDSQLARSRGKYLFTAGHLPVYSASGRDEKNCLEDKLLPLLIKHRANGHIAGRHHRLQHIKVKGTGGVELDFITSGAASYIEDQGINHQSIPAGSFLYHWADTSSGGGLALAEVTSDNFTLTFINAEGDKLYEAGIKPRKV